ncbi:MAG TPA: SDR family oxidoreductase [Streptosporangiaceae bacterium]
MERGRRTPGRGDGRGGQRQAGVPPLAPVCGAPPDVAARIFEARIPLARHACPEEIARSVLCLASPDSSFVTGAALVVDGGMNI